MIPVSSYLGTDGIGQQSALWGHHRSVVASGDKIHGLLWRKIHNGCGYRPASRPPNWGKLLPGTGIYRRSPIAHILLPNVILDDNVLHPVIVRVVDAPFHSV